jgi:hypothetical protein
MYQHATTRFSIPTPSRHKRIIAGIIAFIAIVYLAWYVVAFSRYPADDAYIHMRIARNFVTHGVPYFNIDQPVSGSSSLLWLILLSGLFAVFGPKPEVALIPSIVSVVGIFILGTAIISKRYPLLAALIWSFLLTVCTVIASAAALMETPLAICLWLLSLRYLERAAYGRASLYAALACITRYEFVVWLMLVFVYTPQLKLMPRLFLGAIVPILVLVGFNLFFFQSLVPNTVIAKSIVYSLNIHETLFTAGIYPNSIIFLLALLLNVLLIWQVFRRQAARSLGFVAIFGCAILGLYVIRNIFVFPWYTPIYLFPLLFMHILVASYNVIAVRIVAVALMLYFGFGSAQAALYGAEALALDQHQTNLVGMRVQQYLNIGNDLAHTYPHATIMAAEIGGLGWTFPGKIVDAIGLVSPECLEYHPLNVPRDRASGLIGAIPPQAVQDLRPDIIVSMEIFSEAVRRDMSNGAIAEYRLLRNYPVTGLQPSILTGDGVLWGSQWTQVFVRNKL